MKTYNFSEFLLESDNSKDAIQLVILSNKNLSSKTIDGIEKSCKKNKYTYRIIDIDTVTLEKTDTDYWELDDETNKKVLINPQRTVVLARRGVVRNTFTQNMLTRLEEGGFYCVNRLQSILDCENKFTTLRRLESAGVPVPKSALVYSVDDLETSVEKIGGKFPIIMKLLSGTHGIGVSIIDSFASLKSVLQTFYVLEPSIEVLLQEKIDADFDLRIHVLSRSFNTANTENGESVIIASMKRTKADKDFRTNFSIGGGVDTVKLTKEQQEIAINSARVLGCNWCGVDLIVDKKTGKNYVLEVNASAGTSGITQATGIDVVGKVLTFLLDTDNWIRRKTEVGFLETITVLGVGEFVCKFDTGNGSYSSSVHASSYEVDEIKNVVNWEIDGKKFKSKFVGWTNSILGKTKERRPKMEVDLEFMGHKYPATVVSPVLRHDKSTPFLANRAFMDLANLVINPKKVFFCTEFKEYDLASKSEMNGINLFK
jgi:ribosomal protein S6--L-glutamate ligase